MAGKGPNVNIKVSSNISFNKLIEDAKNNANVKNIKTNPKSNNIFIDQNGKKELNIEEVNLTETKTENSNISNLEKKFKFDEKTINEGMTLPLDEYYRNQKMAEFQEELREKQAKYEEEEYRRLNPEMPKYDLSLEELRGIASLCEQEQGSPEGAAAEASLMANLYEMKGQNYSSLYDYVKDSGWFANADYFMSNTSNLDPQILEVVNLVLTEGKRTLPRYIDEHDCFSDISDISSGDVYSKEDYIKDETKINNVYGAKYTFYSFPSPTSDPFGYSSEQKKAELGEDHYEFDRILADLNND